MTTNNSDDFQNDVKKDNAKSSQNLKQELSSIIATGEAGGGFVKITLDGNFEMHDIQIDKDIVTVDRVLILQDLIKSAYIDAHEKITPKILEISASFRSSFNSIKIPSAEELNSISSALGGLNLNDIASMNLGNMNLGNINLANLDLSKIDMSKIDMSKIDLSKLNMADILSMLSNGKGDDKDDDE